MWMRIPNTDMQKLDNIKSICEYDNHQELAGTVGSKMTSTLRYLYKDCIVEIGNAKPKFRRM